MPYSANLMLRQVGLVLFLAGVGTRAGYDFYSTVSSGQGTLALVTALVVVMVVGLTTLFLGRKLLRMPMGLLTGVVAGVQTQPATLAFALEQSRDDYPNIGYATVFPFAVIGKIVLAQLLLVLMGV
jgi:putative transport protein